MKKGLIVIGAVALAGVMTGCFTMSPEERREAYQKEYSRLAALPPAQMVQSPNPDIANCAKLSCDLFNEVRPMMKAYVDKTESNREYTGFMNDIQYYVKEEKMSEKDACKKVADAVIAADADRPDDQKVWPKIKKGIAAANELEPKKQLAQIALLLARNSEIVNSIQRFKDSDAFKNMDIQGKIARGKECSAIIDQSEDTGKCLYFLQDQYTRVLMLELYAR